MSNIKIVLLTSPGFWGSNIVEYFLKNNMPIYHIVSENPINKYKIIRRRIKKLGLRVVFGQILFKILVTPILQYISRSRIRYIIQNYQLVDSTISPDTVSHVNSVNDYEVIRLLKCINPDLVLVAGTRIIKPKIINCINAPFINIHAGITPQYRGVHGGYWSLVENNHNLCGVTVHLVDKGIDTGKIIAQSIIHPTPDDNFVTYPLLQLAAGLPLLYRSVQAFAVKQLDFIDPLTTTSKLRSHPTLWFFLYHWLRYGVK